MVALADFGCISFCNSYFAVFLIITADLLIKLQFLQKNGLFVLDKVRKRA